MSGMLVRIILWSLILFEGYQIVTLGIREFKKAKNQGKKAKLKAFLTVAFVPAMMLSVLMVFTHLSFVNSDTEVQADIMQTYDYIDVDYAAPYKVKDSILEKIDEIYWDKIPKSQKDMFKSEWKVIFDDVAPSIMKNSLFIKTNPYNKGELNIIGTSYSQKRLIWLDYRYIDEFENTYIHEHGHSISYELGTLHGSLEWRLLYHKYKDKMPDIWDYYTSDSSEFFAHCYSLYFLDSEYLQEAMPDVYKYMDEVNHTEISDNYFSKLYIGLKGVFNQLFLYLI